MKRGIVALMVVFGFASPAQAAPGDPRLVQGVLEWPAKLTVEPFVVIRTDDGRWYYAEVKAAKRFGSGPLSAGGRVTVLGTEAARPHEIAAIAFGSGDAAALALALMPHANAAASAPAPAPAAQPPSSPRTESLAAKVEPSATPKAEVPTPKIAAKAEPVATTPVAAPTPAARPAPAVTTTPVAAPVPPAPAAPSVLASPPTAASTPAPAKPAPEPPAVAPSAPAAPRVVESPTPAPPAAEKSMAVNEPEPAGDGPRWTELRGTVKVIAGNWIVVRTDKGQLVLVDLSTVRGGAASLRPGAAIALYGTPTEQKFQAMGIVPPDNRPAPRPATIPPRR